MTQDLEAVLPLGSTAVLWEGSRTATGSVPHVRPAAALAATQASAAPELQPVLLTLHRLGEAVKS